MLIIDQLKKGDPQLRTLSLGVLLGLGILLSGLLYVQVLSSRRFKASQVNQSFRTVRIPATRGRIFDAHGTPLADNRPNYTVNLYLEELRPEFQTAYNRTLEALRAQSTNAPKAPSTWARWTARLPFIGSGPTPGKPAPAPRLSTQDRLILGRDVRYAVASNLVNRVASSLALPTDLDPGQFHEHYNQRLALPMPVFSDLPLEQVSRFVERASTLPGFELEVQPVRSYPYGKTAAHILGYLKRNDRPEEEDLFTRYSLPDYAGATGIERSLDRSLRGRAGVKSVLVNNLGYRQSENIWAQAEAGQNLTLTLDLDIQRAAEEALRSTGGDTRGAIVVMDVDTGDLLAMASNPAFDPNRFLPRLREDDWASYRDDPRLPLINRATMGTYMPGSIFKIVVALAALEAGILDPDKTYSSPGYYQLGNRKIKDTASGGQPTSFNFRKAFKQSSNAYFVHYGLLAGLDDIVALGQRLHLGEKTGLPLPRGDESPGTFPTEEWRNHALHGQWKEGDTANLSLGQGFVTVTPIQMAVMTAAVANGGRVLWPRLVARVEPQESSGEHEAVSLPARRVRDHLGVSPRALRIVREGMLADTEDEDGTGTGARVEGLRIGAKTGTAQVERRNPKRMDHITWFASFAPFEKPRFAVIVMIESGVSGGTTCAPVARQVYLALQKHRPPTAPSLATSP